MKNISLHLLTCLFLLLTPLFATPSLADKAEPEANKEASATEDKGDPLEKEAKRLLEVISKLTTSGKELENRIRQATGEDRLILEQQNWQRQLEVNAALKGLIANIDRQMKKGRDVEAEKKQIRRLLEEGYSRALKRINEQNTFLAKLRKKRDEANESDTITIEGQIRVEEIRLQSIYRISVETLNLLKRYEIEVKDRGKRIKALLTERAKVVAGRVNLGRERLEDLESQQETDPENSALRAKVESAKRGLNNSTDLLSSTVALMAKLDLERSQYQQLLLTATGQITADVLEAKVVLGLLKTWWQGVWEYAKERGPSWLVQLLFVGIILLFFRMLSGITAYVVGRSVRSSKFNISRLLQESIISWSSRLVMVFGVLIALDQLGVAVGPLLAGLGIAGFVIGFALQDSLSNLAAGAMILFYQPFDEGDVIEAAGITGKVNRLSMASTTILTFDNQTLIVPNQKIWGDVIRNITAQKIRRVDLVFPTKHSESIERIEKVLLDVVQQHEKVLEDPAPTIKLHKITDSSMDFIVRPWCKKADYWGLYWDLTRAIKLRFDSEGIEIPFPHRSVHVVERTMNKSHDSIASRHHDKAM